MPVLTLIAFRMAVISRVPIGSLGCSRWSDSRGLSEVVPAITPAHTKNRVDFVIREHPVEIISALLVASCEVLFASAQISRGLRSKPRISPDPWLPTDLHFWHIAGQHYGLPQRRLATCPVARSVHLSERCWRKQLEERQDHPPPKLNFPSQCVESVMEFVRLACCHLSVHSLYSWLQSKQF